MEREWIDSTSRDGIAAEAQGDVIGLAQATVEFLPRVWAVL